MSDQRLLHWSDKPLELDRKRRVPARGLAYKPAGLWISVGDGDDGWRCWCEGENFALNCLKHCAEITFKPEANVLRLSSLRDLDEFTATHGVEPERFSHFELQINWDAVRSYADAIIIAPYQWQKRLSLFWYYGWDCASGCIWNFDAIAEVKALSLTELA